MIDKKKIRENISLKRKLLSLEFRKNAANKICLQLSKIDPIKQAKTIALYYGCQGEANPFLLTQMLIDKTWLLPVVCENSEVRFIQFQSQNELTKNNYGILEPPCDGRSIKAANIDVIILPLVGFDVNGNRLGRGKGYYDRTLSFMKKAHQKPYLIGVGYEFQKVDQLPIDDWDIPLNMIITEQNIYRS